MELVPQGRAKDAAARNANIQPLDIAGVWAAPPLVHANVDKLDAYEGDDDDGIIAVADIPQQPPHAPLIIHDTNDEDVESDEGADDTESNDEESDDEDDAESNDDKPSDLAAMNQAKIKECKDRGAEERASPRSTPITVY